MGLTSIASSEAEVGASVFVELMLWVEDVIMGIVRGREREESIRSTEDMVRGCADSTAAIYSACTQVFVVERMGSSDIR